MQVFFLKACRYVYYLQINVVFLSVFGGQTVKQACGIFAACPGKLSVYRISLTSATHQAKSHLTITSKGKGDEKNNFLLSEAPFAGQHPTAT
jgi:hypothetical protein